MNFKAEDNYNMKTPKFGDVYLIKFEGVGSEQRGLRPGIIFQNNIGNVLSPNVVVLPLTSAIKKQSQPTHVFLPADGTGLLKDSVVLCENPYCISKNKLGQYLTTIPDEYFGKIAKASILASAAISYIDEHELTDIIEKALLLNNVA